MKKSIILFDQQVYRMQNYGGVSRYFSHLIYELERSKDFKVLPTSYFSENLHLASLHLESFGILKRLGKFKGHGRIKNFLKQREDRKLLNYIKKGKYDVFHPTYYQHDFLKYLPPNMPLIITVYDMIHELYLDPILKTIHRETILKSILIPRADHIIAISKNTKQDIIGLYPDIDPEKISVIYLGHSFSEVDAQQSTIPGKYILYVGQREHYKNFIWMLGSVGNFLIQNNILLVCAGGGVFTESEIQIIEENQLREKVLYKNIPDDQVLGQLYKNAFCFVFPSLFEGFGIPILEAFANKCPAVLSMASCFPEIATNAALYFDTHDVYSLELQLSRLLNDSILRNQLIEAGTSRLKYFGWDKMVEAHKKVYHQILGK